MKRILKTHHNPNQHSINRKCSAIEQTTTHTHHKLNSEIETAVASSKIITNSESNGDIRKIVAKTSIVIDQLHHKLVLKKLIIIQNMSVVKD